MSGFALLEQMDIAAEIVILNLLRLAIETWQNSEDARIGQNIKDAESSARGEFSDIVYQCIAEESGTVHFTAGIMYAGLGVAIAALVENWVIRFAINLSPSLAQRRNSAKCQERPGWGEYIGEIQKVISAKFDDMPGFKGNKLARALANCFKHNDSKASDELSRISPYRKDDPIDFHKQDWAGMIKDTQQFLTEMVNRLPDGAWGTRSVAPLLIRQQDGSMKMFEMPKAHD